MLYTYMAVREDGTELFGFSTEEELSAFKMLITVSGVGPKAAISILSTLTPEKLALAICTEDKKAISQANGIGPKTAARIILELKDKLKADGIGEADFRRTPISDRKTRAARHPCISRRSELSASVFRNRYRRKADAARDHGTRLLGLYRTFGGICPHRRPHTRGKRSSSDRT